MYRILSTAAAAVLALSMTATAGENKAQWQTDDQGGVDQQSFSMGVDEAGAYTKLDADADGSLNEQEFGALGEQFGIENTGAYAEWDGDADGMISQEEFSAGLYRSYDADGDAYINSDELSTMNNSELFTIENADDPDTQQGDSTTNN